MSTHEGIEPSRRRRTAAGAGAGRREPPPRRERVNFVPTPGSRLSKDDAQLVGKRLRLLERRHGSLTAQIVAEDAASPRSPLHQFFEWSDAKAAVEYRLVQARQLLRAVAIMVVDSNGAETAMRAFMAPFSEEEGGRRYLSVDVVASRLEYVQSIVADARRELEGWMSRYSRYRELGALVNEIRKAMALAEKMP